MGCRSLRTLFASLLAALLIAGAATAQEVILSFQSDVRVEASGDYTVTETIRVRAEGQQIRRGIYRDFPTTLMDENGEIVSTGFDLVSATRDGQPETSSVKDGGSFTRITLGHEDVFLSPGIYVYELTYRTDRQVRFFPTHDEIYWNATGTEWDFPIKSARAVFHLPEGAVPLETAIYTGPFGATDQNAEIRVSHKGDQVVAETTQALGPREGLTVAISLPKGALRPPSDSQKRRWFLRDNMGALIAVPGGVAIFVYYLLAWRRVGRDPARGVVVPRWDAPDGIAPALVHYIWNRGLRHQGFPALSAATLGLAVRGFLELNDIGDTITLRRTSKPTKGAGLQPGEAALVASVTNAGGMLEIATAQGEKVAALGQSFAQAMEREHRNVYYRHNQLWIFAGLALSTAVLVAAFMFGNLDADHIVFLIPSFVVGGLLMLMALGVAKSWGGGLRSKFRLVFITFGLVVMFANISISTIGEFLISLDQPILNGALVSVVLVNVLFFFLLGAPTPIGQTRTDEIAGLKRYLTVAEEDRMNMRGAPRMSPEHFESLLPYAVALNVEKPWTKAFDTWLTTAAAAGVTYAPHWYHGDSVGSQSFGDHLADLGGALSSSMTSALPVPESSSSGFSDGGSSGGGGGGGGGGGW